MFYVQILIARGFLSLLRPECHIVFTAVPLWLLPTQPHVISYRYILAPGAVRILDLRSVAWKDPAPSPFWVPAPQKPLCKSHKILSVNKTRRSFALVELDLTCCCLYQLLWEENQVERQSGAWQMFPSSPHFSSNVNDFPPVGSVRISCVWICMPLLIAERIKLLQTICCCYSVHKYVISHCKK